MFADAPRLARLIVLITVLLMPFGMAGAAAAAGHGARTATSGSPTICPRADCSRSISCPDSLAPLDGKKNPIGTVGFVLLKLN